MSQLKRCVVIIAIVAGTLGASAPAFAATPTQDRSAESTSRVYCIRFNLWSFGSPTFCLPPL
jgi:hypothetical protein